MARGQKHQVGSFPGQVQGCLRSKARGCLISRPATRLPEVTGTRLLDFQILFSGILLFLISGLVVWLWLWQLLIGHHGHTVTLGALFVMHDATSSVFPPCPVRVCLQAPP